MFYENHPFTLFPIHLAPFHAYLAPLFTVFFVQSHAVLMAFRCLYPQLTIPIAVPTAISPKPNGVGPAIAPADLITLPADPMASKMALVRVSPDELKAFTVCTTVSVPEKAISAHAKPLPNLLKANPFSLAALVLQLQIVDLLHIL